MLNPFSRQRYDVVFHENTQKHYIKSFKKRYKKNWDVTQRSVEKTLERIFYLYGTNQMDIICTSNKNSILAKFEFKVAGCDMSAKSSGNRCILSIDNTHSIVSVVLVYHKKNIRPHSTKETNWWKDHLKKKMNLSCC